MADTLGIVWEGSDGSTWDLMAADGPVLGVSFDGLGLPGFVQQYAETGARDGRLYEGTTWGANEVAMTVNVGCQRFHEQDWRDLDAAWWRSVSAERTGRLLVTSAAGTRYLSLRLAEPAPPPANRNPALFGEAVYALKLTADDEPWWVGEEVTTGEFPWRDAGVPFFGGPNGALLTISRSATINSATISNPGDRPAWLRWFARGPFESITVGVGSELVTVPVVLEDTQVVQVDTFAQTVTDGSGNDLWPAMGFTDPIFAPVPGRGQVSVTIRMAGAAPGAAVGLALTPRYERPW